MTVAVCILCGNMKVGAFTACLGCGFTPKQPKELAKSMVLSDQFRDQPFLDEASARLKSGLVVEYDPKEVANLAAFIDANFHELRMPLGCAIIWYAPLVILAVLLLIWALWFVNFFWWTG